MKTANTNTYIFKETELSFTCNFSSLIRPFSYSHFVDLFTISKAYNEKLLIVFANIRV
ncbi:hypothetical protein [Flavobacterium indicum]|uniref:hypothetical protein n=1 Tax=Flavobacterium indicum TaxID=312277 RepID=UPI0002EEBD2E|nr:hypothetical protein [Flavobacterium indicum]